MGGIYSDNDLQISQLSDTGSSKSTFKQLLSCNYVKTSSCHISVLNSWT